MSGWEKSPEYGGGWGGWWSTAAAVAAIVAIALALTNCAPEAAQMPAAEQESAVSDTEPVRAPGEDPCTAPLPSGVGSEFAGVVRHVIDGDSLCVGPVDGDGSTWIEVRLMDFDAPEANEGGGAAAEQTLERLVSGREAQCTVTRGRSGATRSWDRVHAICRVGGETVGDLMRAAGVAEGGN